jgi:uncharacterized protein
MDELTQEQIGQFVGVSHGDLAKVKELLEAEPRLLDARYEEWDERPIQAASHVGNRPIAEYLLGKGAPLNIFTAAMLGMTEQVRDYLAADASLASANGVHGISILFHAALSGQVEIADLLVANGGGQDASNALHGAVAFGHTEMARWLLGQGADPNPRNWQEKTPLQVAEERGYTELAALLREAGGVA